MAAAVLTGVGGMIAGGAIVGAAVGLKEAYRAYMQTDFRADYPGFTIELNDKNKKLIELARSSLIGGVIDHIPVNYKDAQDRLLSRVPVKMGRSNVRDTKFDQANPDAPYGNISTADIMRHSAVYNGARPSDALRRLAGYQVLSDLNADGSSKITDQRILFHILLDQQLNFIMISDNYEERLFGLTKLIEFCNGVRGDQGLVGSSAFRGHNVGFAENLFEIGKKLEQLKQRVTYEFEHAKFAMAAAKIERQVQVISEQLTVTIVKSISHKCADKSDAEIIGVVGKKGTAGLSKAEIVAADLAVGHFKRTPAQVLAKSIYDTQFRQALIPSLTDKINVTDLGSNGSLDDKIADVLLGKVVAASEKVGAIREDVEIAAILAKSTSSTEKLKELIGKAIGRDPVNANAVDAMYKLIMLQKKLEIFYDIGHAMKEMSRLMGEMAICYIPQVIGYIGSELKKITDVMGDAAAFLGSTNIGANVFGVNTYLQSFTNFFDGAQNRTRTALIKTACEAANILEGRDLKQAQELLLSCTSVAYRDTTKADVVKNLGKILEYVSIIGAPPTVLAEMSAFSSSIPLAGSAPAVPEEEPIQLVLMVSPTPHRDLSSSFDSVSSDPGAPSPSGASPAAVFTAAPAPVVHAASVEAVLPAVVGSRFAPTPEELSVIQEKARALVAQSSLSARQVLTMDFDKNYGHPTRGKTLGFCFQEMYTKIASSTDVRYNLFKDLMVHSDWKDQFALKSDDEKRALVANYRLILSDTNKSASSLFKSNDNKLAQIDSALASAEKSLEANQGAYTAFFEATLKRLIEAHVAKACEVADYKAKIDQSLMFIDKMIGSYLELCLNSDSQLDASELRVLDYQMAMAKCFSDSDFIWDSTEKALMDAGIDSPRPKDIYQVVLTQIQCVLSDDKKSTYTEPVAKKDDELKYYLATAHEVIEAQYKGKAASEGIPPVSLSIAADPRERTSLLQRAANATKQVVVGGVLTVAMAAAAASPTPFHHFRIHNAGANVTATVQSRKQEL